MQKYGVLSPGIVSHPCSFIHSLFNLYLLCTYVLVLSAVYIISYHIISYHTEPDRHASIIKFSLVWQNKQVIKIIMGVTKRET